MTRATWANFVIWSSIHTICFAMIRNVNSCYWRHTIRRGAFLLISSWTFSLNVKQVPLLTIQIPNSLKFYVQSLIFSLNSIWYFFLQFFLFFVFFHIVNVVVVTVLRLNSAIDVSKCCCSHRQNILHLPVAVWWKRPPPFCSFYIRMNLHYNTIR